MTVDALENLESWRGDVLGSKCSVEEASLGTGWTGSTVRCSVCLRLAKRDKIRQRRKRCGKKRNNSRSFLNQPKRKPFGISQKLKTGIGNPFGAGAKGRPTGLKRVGVFLLLFSTPNTQRLFTPQLRYFTLPPCPPQAKALHTTSALSVVATQR
jgi:hypothetical protein